MPSSGVRWSSPVSNLAVEESAAVPEATIGVFSNSRSSRSNGKRTTKRQKLSGMNARFDRMVNSLQDSHRSNENISRKRSRSASSSSVNSYAYSQDIFDAYSDLQHGTQIGDNFALVKRKTPSKHANSQSPSGTINDTDILKITSTQQPEKSLPAWLSDTFSTLEPANPLRYLIPKGLAVDDPQPSTTTEENDGSMFAFTVSPAPSTSHQPTAASVDASNSFPNLVAHDHSKTDKATFASSLSTSGPRHRKIASNILDDTFALPRTPLNISSQLGDEFVPFSKPGPASTLSTSSPVTALIPLHSDPNIAEAQFSLPVHLTRPSRTNINKMASDDQLMPPIELGWNHQQLNFTHPAPISQYDEVQEDLPDLAHYDDTLTDDSGSDPYFDPANTSHTAIDISDSLNVDVYKTPGPTYYASQPLFFDSPTEETIGSDPNYQIDYGDLDFSWTPFFHDQAKDDILHNRFKPASVQFAEGISLFEGQDTEVYSENDEEDETDIGAFQGEGTRTDRPTPLAVFADPRKHDET